MTTGATPAHPTRRAVHLPKQNASAECTWFSPHSAPQHQRGVLATRGPRFLGPGPLCAGLSCLVWGKQGRVLDLLALKLTWGVN